MAYPCAFASRIWWTSTITKRKWHEIKYEYSQFIRNAHSWRRQLRRRQTNTHYRVLLPHRQTKICSDKGEPEKEKKRFNWFFMWKNRARESRDYFSSRCTCVTRVQTHNGHRTRPRSTLCPSLFRSCLAPCHGRPFCENWIELWCRACGQRLVYINICACISVPHIDRDSWSNVRLHFSILSADDFMFKWKWIVWNIPGTMVNGFLFL